MTLAQVTQMVKWQSRGLRFKPGLCDFLAAYQEQEFL